MRISILKNDPDFTKKGFMYTVKLNGKHLDNCVTADDEKGEVLVRNKTSKFGSNLRTIKGKVEIILTGEASNE